MLYPWVPASYAHPKALNDTQEMGSEVDYLDRREQRKTPQIGN